jgi:uncharacterized protein YgiM (DUF1202 family)
VRHECGAVGWASANFLTPFGNTARRMIVADPRDGWLNLRTGPGTGFAIVDRLDNGTVVQVLEQSGTWVRVRLEYRIEGWAYRPYLAPLSQ